MTVEDYNHWYDETANLVTLTAWMADNDWTAREIAAAVEKPWHYTAEYERAHNEQAL